MLSPSNLSIGLRQRVQMGGGGDRAGVKIIIDLDQSSDVGDAAANAIAMYLMSQSVVNVKGIVVDVTNTYAPGATDAINTYYGFPSIPIGANKGSAFDPSGPGAYAQHLAQNFTNDIVTASNATEGIALYRQLLAAAANSSIVIVALGPLNMLSLLLASSADGYSALNGSALVAAKVSELVVMGGDWPNSASAEWNFDQDKAAANDVVANWPTPIVLFGFAPGNTVYIGAGISDNTPVGNPVRKAHELTSHEVSGRQAWDAFPLLYAARGLADATYAYFTRVRGTAVVNASTGQNTWTDDAGGNHYYLVKALHDLDYEDLFNAMLYYDPGETVVNSLTPLQYDTFTDANGTSLDAHTPNIGGAWIEASGQWEIQSNRAAAIGATPAEPVWVAVRETGESDVHIAAELSVIADYGGLIFRYVDNANMWLAAQTPTGIQLFERTAGTWTGRGAATTTVNTGATLTIRTKGTQIKFYVDDVLKLTITNAAHQTATKHGLRATANTARFDTVVIRAML